MILLSLIKDVTVAPLPVVKQNSRTKQSGNQHIRISLHACTTWHLQFTVPIICHSVIVM